jgi:hypothetical protein
MTAFVANTNVLELTGLTSNIEEAFINDATVTVTVKDTADVDVTGETWPVTMDYITDSDGNYRAILIDALPLVGNRKYIAHISADGGEDRIGYWKFEFTPQDRVVQDVDE